MNYRICELESFSVIGQEIELTNRQKENIQICVDFCLKLWYKYLVIVKCINIAFLRAR